MWKYMRWVLLRRKAKVPFGKSMKTPDFIMILHVSFLLRTNKKKSIGNAILKATKATKLQNITILIELNNVQHRETCNRNMWQKHATKQLNEEVKIQIKQMQYSFRK